VTSSNNDLLSDSARKDSQHRDLSASDEKRSPQDYARAPATPCEQLPEDAGPLPLLSSVRELWRPGSEGLCLCLRSESHRVIVEATVGAATEGRPYNYAPQIL